MVHEKQVINWIKEQVDKAGARGAVVGLSGGIDSSLTTVLCKKALEQHVLGLMMPCSSDNKDIEDALLLSSRFNIKVYKVDITGTYNKLLEQLPYAGMNIRANIKPRLRMSILYYFANMMNYLVCGTSNKSELMTGYFTKYGDGGVDMMPLGGMLKKDVKRISKKLGIPSRIINRTPSAGLWDGQTDEEEMDMTYTELDTALEEIEKGKKTGRGRVKKVLRMKKLAEHKMRTPAIFNCK